MSNLVAIKSKPEWLKTPLLSKSRALPDCGSKSDDLVRSIDVRGDDAFVPLTRGLVAVIDVDDVPLVSGRLWHAHVCRGGTYARTWVRDAEGELVGLLLHKAITGYQMTDHIDGDGLNNRRANLRKTSRAENNQNSRMQKNNKSGFKGVSQARSGRWRARIAVECRQITLGTFDSPQEAHRAYCSASKKLHGEFGRSQ